MQCFGLALGSIPSLLIWNRGTVRDVQEAGRGVDVGRHGASMQGPILGWCYYTRYPHVHNTVCTVQT